MTVSVTTSGPVGADPNTATTLEDIIRSVTNEVGLEMPEKIIGSTDRTAIELLSFAEKACEDITRRVDWGTLVTSVEFTGTGSDASFSFPISFSRLIDGSAITLNSNPIRGGLTEDEWATLPAQTGNPKYYRLTGNTVRFWPYLNTTETVKATYITNAYTSQGLNKFAADDDAVTIPAKLVELNMIWRWLRHISQSYEDEMAEYEAALVDYADFDSGPRTP